MRAKLSVFAVAAGLVLAGCTALLSAAEIVASKS